MAVLPTRSLEIEFDAGVWTDVTADFVELASKRGRNRELGAFETGTISFTLRNDARKYDPDNTAGPYYGKLRPNRRVRLRATYAAVTYPVFLGYIDRIAQVGQGPNAAAAVFTASDFFKLLNRAELVGSVYAAETAADTPDLWWRLGDPSGSTVVADSSGNNLSGAVVGATLGESSVTVRDPDGAAGFTETANTWIGPGQLTIDQSAPFAIEFWIRLRANPTFLQLVAHGSQGSIDWGTTSYYAVFLSTPGRLLSFHMGNSAGTIYQANVVAPALTAGSAHHVVITHAADRVLRIYIDGALAVTGDTTAGNFQINNHFLGSVGALAASNAVIDEYAIYSGTIPSATRIGVHNAAGRTPWNGDLPGARLGRIFDLAAVPALDRNIDAGTTTLQATDLGGTALAYAQKVEETELGWLFVARDGKLRFIGRQAGVTGAYLTSLATLVDDDSGAGLPYRSADADVDEAIIVTRSTASREGSVAVTVYDAAAKAEFGWLDETHDGLLHDSDAYSRYYAEWILNTHKAPSSRVGTVALELTKDPAALYPAILALELGDRVTYKRKPQNVGAVTTIVMRVEAISHETGPHYWRTRLQLSPFNLAAGLPVGEWNLSLWDQAVWGF